MGDDNLDIASLIAAEVGQPTPTTDDHSKAAQLNQTLARLTLASTAFQVLGLSQEADTDALRSAYMDLASQLHPDKYTDAPEGMQTQAIEAFDQIQTAWDAIDTPEKRAAYIDHVILGKPTEDELAMAEVRALLDAEADFKKGLAAFNAGRTSAAHKCFVDAVEAAPEELEFCAYKAYTTFALNRKTDLECAMGALSDLKDILDANQHQERRLDGGWVLLGRAYRELGEHEPAKRALVQALRYNPANPDAPRELRRLEGRSAAQQVGDGKKKPGFFGKLVGKK